MKREEFERLCKTYADKPFVISREYISMASVDGNCIFNNMIFIDCSFEKCKFNNVNGYRMIFSHCHFDDCEFSRCDFSYAVIVNCTFTLSKIHDFNLIGAVLTGTCFSECKVDLLQTNHDTQGYEMACPETGAFEAWKKCCDKTGRRSRIVHLLIPADANRSSGSERKCRASKAIVLGIESENGNPCRVAYSLRCSNFSYHVGETVEAPDFNEDRWRTCAAGIHFFMTKREAKSY